MRWEFQRAQGRLPKFRNAQKNGFLIPPKAPPSFAMRKKMGFLIPQKAPQVSRYAKNRGFEYAKNALQSFANSSKPKNNTL